MEAHAMPRSALSLVPPGMALADMPDRAEILRLLEGRFNDLHEGISDMRESLHTLTKTQSHMEVNQARIEGTVKAIDGAMSSVQTGLAKYDDLDRRVLLQGQRLDDVQRKLDHACATLDADAHERKTKRWDLTKLAIQIGGAGLVATFLGELVKQLMKGGT